MSSEAYRSTLKLSATVCLTSVFLFLIAPNTFAADTQSDKEQNTVKRSASVETHNPGSHNPRSSVTIVDPVSPTAASEQSGQNTAGGNTQSGTSAPTTPSTPAVKSLTPNEKFKYFARSSFMPPMPYALSILSGVFSEATDKDHGRHMTGGDFAADSMTHAARSFAFRATANLFEKYAFASGFKQDPRYFRSDKKGFARIGYAVSRVFVTRSDSGTNQFNASFFAGGLVAAGISNAWARPEDRTAASTMSRFAFHVGYRALSNVVRELFGKR
jgi:hypothetical protein